MCKCTFSIWVVWGYYFLKYSFCAFFFFVDSHFVYVIMLNAIPQVSVALFIVLSLCFSGRIISVDLSPVYRPILLPAQFLYWALPVNFSFQLYFWTLKLIFGSFLQLISLYWYYLVVKDSPTLIFLDMVPSVLWNVCKASLQSLTSLRSGLAQGQFSIGCCFPISLHIL